MSTDDGTAGGFEGLPLVGSPEAIGTQKEALNFRWLRSRQLALRPHVALRIGIDTQLSLPGCDDRKQRLLFWMAAYTFMPVLELVLNGLRLPVSDIWLTWIIQTAIASERSASGSS